MMPMVMKTRVQYGQESLHAVGISAQGDHLLCHVTSSMKRSNRNRRTERMETANMVIIVFYLTK